MVTAFARAALSIVAAAIAANALTSSARAENAVAADIAAALAGAARAQPWAGPVPPALALTTPDGAAAQLAAAGGGVTIVTFFATWCEPCAAELAALDMLAARRAYSVIAVNAAEPASRVQRFLDAKPVRFPVLMDADRAALKAWGVASLPATFAIDADGAPLWRVDGELGRTASDIHNAIDAATAASAADANQKQRRKP